MTRDSSYFFPKENTVTDSILRRVRDFEGHWPNISIEPIRIQKYDENGHFGYHHDAMDDRDAFRGNRIATFMIYLEDNASGGGTHFPELKTSFNTSDKCDIIDCSGLNNGTTFWPIAGNAIFWMNVLKDGRRNPEMIHAGLPVVSGVKTIMNIWLWKEWELELVMD